jgi:hypothetical protein
MRGQDAGLGRAKKLGQPTKPGRPVRQETASKEAPEKIQEPKQAREKIQEPTAKQAPGSRQGRAYELTARRYASVPRPLRS